MRDSPRNLIAGILATLFAVFGVAMAVSVHLWIAVIAGALAIPFSVSLIVSEVKKLREERATRPK